MKKYLIEVSSVTKSLIAVEADSEKAAIQMALNNPDLPRSTIDGMGDSLESIITIPDDEYEEFVNDNS